MADSAADFSASHQPRSRIISDLIRVREPKSLEVCCLLEKPDVHKVDLPVKYVGFQIPDEFVVGYGLDYNGEYRNLPYIGVLEY